MVRKRRKKSKNYFTQETEDAIVLYNNTSDSEVRSKIYEREIHYAFFKLTENIIHTFKFYHTEVSNLEHLQHEIITFLLSKIHLFDPSNTTFVKHFIARTSLNYGSPRDTFVAGHINNTTAIDEISFAFTSGNCDSGTIDMYGVL